MRWGGQPAHCSLVARPMRKECQLLREASSAQRQSASREAGNLGVALSAVRRGVASRVHSPRLGRQAPSERAPSPHYPACRRRQGRWACPPKPPQSHHTCSDTGRLRTCLPQRGRAVDAAWGALSRRLQSPKGARRA
eukprot:6146960-Pleurochrysis_carterae.AAC.2